MLWRLLECIHPRPIRQKKPDFYQTQLAGSWIRKRLTVKSCRRNPMIWPRRFRSRDGGIHVVEHPRGTLIEDASNEQVRHAPVLGMLFHKSSDAEFLRVKGVDELANQLAPLKSSHQLPSCCALSPFLNPSATASPALTPISSKVDTENKLDQ